MKPLLNVHDVATLLCIHHKKVQRLARTGVLPALKVGAVYRFRPSTLHAWILSHTRATGATPKDQLTPLLVTRRRQRVS
jgi:excisionase family DNA binding protein